MTTEARHKRDGKLVAALCLVLCVVCGALLVWEFAERRRHAESLRRERRREAQRRRENMPAPTAENFDLDDILSAKY